MYKKKMGLYQLKATIHELLGKIDWHVYEKMGTFISPNDIVIDAGAAEGLFALTVKDRCKHVYCFEVLPDYIDGLKKTFIDENRVTVIDEGLSDCKRTLYVHNRHLCTYIDDNPEGATTSVKVTSIDELFYKKNIPVNFIKADLEGSELKMLQGAINTIKKYKPCIAITTYHFQGDFEKLKNFLETLDLGYIIQKKGIGAYLNGEPTLLHAVVKNKVLGE